MYLLSLSLQSNGSTQALDIDTLGNMVEASMLSPNLDLYGSLHNNGHSFSAYMHDPTHRYLVRKQAIFYTNSRLKHTNKRTYLFFHLFI